MREGFWFFLLISYQQELSNTGAAFLRTVQANLQPLTNQSMKLQIVTVPKASEHLQGILPPQTIIIPIQMFSLYLNNWVPEEQLLKRQLR